MLYIIFSQCGMCVILSKLQQPKCIYGKILPGSCSLSVSPILIGFTFHLFLFIMHGCYPDIMNKNKVEKCPKKCQIAYIFTIFRVFSRKPKQEITQFFYVKKASTEKMVNTTTISAEKQRK